MELNTKTWTCDMKRSSRKSPDIGSAAPHESANSDSLKKPSMIPKSLNRSANVRIKRSNFQGKKCRKNAVEQGFILLFYHIHFNPILYEMAEVMRLHEIQAQKVAFQMLRQKSELQT
jgi:hypothetical protein